MRTAPNSSWIADKAVDAWLNKKISSRHDISDTGYGKVISGIRLHNIAFLYEEINEVLHPPIRYPAFDKN